MSMPSELGEAGSMISVLVEVAGDSYHQRFLALSISDPEPLQREARRLAVQDAKRKAEDLVHAANVVLGNIVQIADDATMTPRGTWNRGFYPAMLSGGAPAPMLVASGTLDIAARVTLTYVVEPPAQ